MPKPYRCPDDDTLLLIFRDDDNDLVLESAYAIYRIPFISFFHSYAGLSIEAAEQLFQQALKILLSEIRSRALEAPCSSSLFKILLAFGFAQQAKNEILDQSGFNQKVKLLKRFYFEADIIITLIDKEDEVAFELLHYCFREPTFRLIQHKLGVNYDQLEFDGEEFYQKATQKLKDKIREGADNSPKPPMRAMLFTYFYKIASWELKNFTKKWAKVKHLTEERDWDHVYFPSQEDPSYLHYLTEKWDQLNKYQFENEKELVLAFSKELGEPQMQLLKDLLKGMKYGEIAERDGKTNEAVRKMAFDCKKKIRKMLGIEID